MEPNNSVDYRLRMVERGQAAIEARLDSRFDGLSRQVNGLSERLDSVIELHQTHNINHHGKGSMLKGGTITAAIAALLFAVAATLERLFL